MDIISNQSIIDVCFTEGCDAYFCSRYVFITIIAIFTALLCVGKIAKYHYNRVKCGYQLSIFYCALGECFCFTIHWVVYVYDVTENIGYWFRVIQLLLICFLYSKLACRVFNIEDTLYKKTVFPVLIIFTLYYLALVPWMITIPRFKYPHKCTEFWHPVYTVSDFILSQGFMVCGILLTRKMTLVSMPSEQLLDQKKQLWGVIIAFEVEAVVSIVYDLLLYTVGHGTRGCGGFLWQHNAGSVIVFVVIRSLRLFVAIWFMLYTFDAQSTDYSEPAQYSYADDDSLDNYMAGRTNSIVPYIRDAIYDVREPLVSENTFDNYFPPDEGSRFGERTQNQGQLIL